MRKNERDCGGCMGILRDVSVGVKRTETLTYIAIGVSVVALIAALIALGSGRNA